ncbi:MAG: hypothetical protein Q8R45_00510 [Brevundimonas sp.]|uniref:hypothetical protein n=1 Tax=Brevundimonas sp. TaxID=1871086 RepID=UPI00271A9E70|nr:hypothetical protein [Brevundimonas sp.]MDO9588800.1 hypothetical protein [Brevundimonas sp.]MDP3369994.1 hypothetical protein [Brevundimonas sp.]MDP3655436.1 hypothetical protein [Brevundimonas sp.]MDZ4108057.1 hypothetical protein [Brevundimonas sp.]
MFLPAIFASLALVQQTPPPQSAPAPVSTQTEMSALPTLEVTQPRPPQSDITPVCRTEPVTGSRFGRRVCRSSIETADERRDSQEALRRMQGSRLPDGGG